MDVPTIRTERLELVSLSPEFVEAILAGRRNDAAELLGAAIPHDWPKPDEKGFLGLRLRQMRADPASQAWLVRGVVLPGHMRTLIGHAGYHGPPGVNGPGDPGAVEIGYRIFAPHRRRGFATEVAAALIQSARSRGVPTVIASVSPDNAPSLAIIGRLGFVQAGERWDDEDGLELVFELRGEP